VVTLVVCVAGACAIVGPLLTPVAVIAGLGATVGALLTPVALIVCLGAIGFGRVGPIAGSIAARLQAGIGNVVAGSLFAAAQSIAMGGAVPAAVIAAVAVIIGLTAAAAAIFGSSFLSMAAAAASVVGTGIGLAAKLFYFILKSIIAKLISLLLWASRAAANILNHKLQTPSCLACVTLFSLLDRS